MAQEIAIFGLINMAVEKCRAVARCRAGPWSAQIRRPMDKRHAQMMVLSVRYSSSEKTKSRFDDAARRPIVMIPWCSGADRWKIHAL